MTSSIHRIDKTAAQLLARARADTGIDLPDTEIEEMLDRLLHSLNTEAELNARGVAAMEERLLRVLKNRLRMKRDIARHPEILEQKIERPLILTGGGRTGSTKLHKVLAASGDFLYLPFWRGYSLGLLSGDRGEDPAPRIEDADRHTRWFDTHAPIAKLIHSYETFEPEEETLLLEHRFCAIYMLAFAFIPSYLQWSQSFMLEDLKFTKRCLQYLQWQFHDGDPRRWLLKTPIHFGNEALVKEVFPDATLVATHRDPIKNMSSTASLLEHYHKAYSDASRKATYGAMMMEGAVITTQKHMETRDANPDLNLLDIAYRELTTHPEQVLEKVYAHAGLPFSAEARRATREWEERNAQHKHGVHHHSLEEYGISAEEGVQRLAAYRERFRPWLA